MMKPMHQWPTSLVVAFGFATGISLLLAGMAFAWWAMHLIRTGVIPLP